MPLCPLGSLRLAEPKSRRLRLPPNHLGLANRASMGDAPASPVPRIAASEPGEMVRTDTTPRVGADVNSAFSVYAGPFRIKPDEPTPAVSDRTWPDRAKGHPLARRPVTAQSPERILDVEGQLNRPPSLLGNTDQRNKGLPSICQEARPGNSVAPLGRLKLRQERSLDQPLRPVPWWR